MSANIISIGTAVPQFEIEQNEVFEFMANAHKLEGKEKDRLKALYRASAIKKRHSVVPDYGTTDKNQWQLYPPNDALDPFPTTKERNKLYQKEAAKLGAQAATNCLNNYQKKSITHLITVSCTGLYAPGLDIDLTHKLGLSKDVKRTCINFMGCYAAITALKNAEAICVADPKAVVLIVCVELCTIHFQRTNDENNLVANALFSDGAAAVLVSSEKTQSPFLKMDKFLSRIYPNGQNEMAWDIGNFGFEMKLTTYVPDLIESGIKQLLSDLGGANADIYAIHPGGKRILDVVEKQLMLDRSQNHFAHDVLRGFGNMSSPTILFVLEKVLASLTEKERGQKVSAMAFGPGLTIETALFAVG